MQSPSNERAQWLVLAVLMLGTAVLTGFLSISPDRYFQPYFGRVPPLLVVGLVSLIRVVSLSFLRSHGFEIYVKRKYRNGLVFSAAFATLFAVEVIIADFRIVFPQDLNVPPPHSLLFYPAIAYIAEITFHTVPLLLFLVALGPLFNKRNTNRLVWVLYRPHVVSGTRFSNGGCVRGETVFFGRHLRWAARVCHQSGTAIRFSTLRFRRVVFLSHGLLFLLAHRLGLHATSSAFLKLRGMAAIDGWSEAVTDNALAPNHHPLIEAAQSEIGDPRDASRKDFTRGGAKRRRAP
jgi:hypothetical protein